MRRGTGSGGTAPLPSPVLLLFITILFDNIIAFYITL